MQRFLVCFFCASVSTWHFMLSLAACTNCFEVTQRIADGTYYEPFAYRQLTPQIIVALGNTVQAHVAFQFIMLLAFFWLLWQWAESWRANGAAAVGLAAVALTMMWPTFYFSSYTTTEWVLWLRGLTWLMPSLSELRQPIVK